MSQCVLGVVMAGGRNSRYGALKALEPVAGRRIIDRVIDALGEVTGDCVVIANDPEAYASVGLPTRPDARGELGPVGGIFTALSWAIERGCDGVLVVACDMPFPSAPLLKHLVDASAGFDVVVPESDSRRGVEPLFAYYAVSALSAIDQSIQQGDLRMIGFHDQVRVHRVPHARILQFGEPRILFMNVNTPEERELAEQLAQEG